jgi:hypothetical protein
MCRHRLRRRHGQRSRPSATSRHDQQQASGSEACAKVATASAEDKTHVVFAATPGRRLAATARFAAAHLTNVSHSSPPWHRARTTGRFRRRLRLGGCAKAAGRVERRCWSGCDRVGRSTEMAQPPAPDRSAAQVAGSATRSAVRPLSFWYPIKVSCVAGPNTPSTAIWGSKVRSRVCKAATSARGLPDGEPASGSRCRTRRRSRGRSPNSPSRDTPFDYRVRSARH